MKVYLDKLSLKQVKALTPKKAVRAYCAWCSGSGDEYPGLKWETSKYIRDCVSECDLHPYRLPVPGTAGLADAIKRHCRECRDTSKLVAACPDQGCPLWQYRNSEARKQRRREVAA